MSKSLSDTHRVDYILQMLPHLQDDALFIYDLQEKLKFRIIYFKGK